MVKNCELCDSPAKMFCDSDQASLCWDCDFKVHSTNFLVARHSRILLCQICQSPTSWSAAGDKICPAVTRCEKCSGEVAGAPSPEERQNRDGAANDDSDELDVGDDAVAEAMKEEEEGEYQVVPWSSMPPPSSPAVSSSSCEDELLDMFPLERNDESCSDLLSGKFQPFDSSEGEYSGGRYKRKR